MFRNLLVEQSIRSKTQLRSRSTDEVQSVLVGGSTILGKGPRKVNART